MSNQASSSRVSSINKTGSTPLIGAVTLSQGTNVTLTQSGQDISIAATGGGGGGGDFMANGTVPMTGLLTLATGTTTVAPLKMVAGTNLTTPIAGIFEFDGTSLFFTI